LKIIYILLISLSLFAQNNKGQEVFETYCWGCHHQTSMAFGPPFNEIASKRNKEEIIGYISSPKSLYKTFGYKRTVMSQLSLTSKELNLISNYILSFKGKE